MRRRLLTLAAVSLVGGYIWWAPLSTDQPPQWLVTHAKRLAGENGPSGALTVAYAGVQSTVSESERRSWSGAGGTRLIRRWLLTHRTVANGRATLRVRFSARAMRELLRAARESNSATIGATVVSVRLRLPLVRQAYRNNCETAALSIFLAGRAGQRRLQAALPVAEPVARSSDGAVWGDPELGFVGDVSGGGYGVYERPLLRLARRYDAGATAISGSTVEAVVAALRQARPVIVWVSLGASVPEVWRTPAGRTVRANFAEHTVVLVGARGRLLVYHDPWDGVQKTMSTSRFSDRWQLLGRRALIGSPLLDKWAG